jgi:glycosyltransferase involved in cell wall biosynthesis
MMRVLFAGVGLTHYFNQILNRLQSDLGVEIHNLVASEGKGHVGAGVHESEHGVEFRIHRLRELVIGPYYRSFRGLPALIRKLAPAIVVAGADYLNAFALDPLLRLSLRLADARLIVKDIPFRLPRYQESLAAARAGDRSWLRRALLELRRATYQVPDGYALYIDEGVEIYGSYGVPAGKIFVTRNSPDTDRLFAARERAAMAPPLLPPNPHRLVHLSRLVAWKRVDLLIDALALVRERLPDAELLVIGEGPERAPLEAHAQARGLAAQVRFAGGVYEPAMLGRYLLDSAVYVLAGMGGLSINDAMCFGKPVVCSVGDGTEKQLVREGHNGFYFESGNAASLAEAVLRILLDPALCRAMGERSTAIVRDEINVATVIDGYRRAFAYVRS